MNIKLEPRLAKVYTMKDAIKAIQNLAGKPLTLSQLVAILSHGVLPDKYMKYKIAYNVIYSAKDDRINQAFGV